MKIKKKIYKNKKFQDIFSKFWIFKKNKNDLKLSLKIENIRFIFKNILIILYKLLEKNISRIILDNTNSIISSNNMNLLKSLNILNNRYRLNEFLKNSSLLIRNNNCQNWILNQIPNIYITTNKKILFFNKNFFSFNYYFFTENKLQNLLLIKLFSYCLKDYRKK